MIVCLCHRVTDRDIVREAVAGCASFEDLQGKLLVGTSCGLCLDTAKDAFHAATRQAGCHRACPGQGHCGGLAVAAS